MRTSYIRHPYLINRYSDIIKCMKPSVVQDKEIVFEYKILASGALAQLLKHTSFSTYQQYVENVFFQYRFRIKQSKLY